MSYYRSTYYKQSYHYDKENPGEITLDQEDFTIHESPAEKKRKKEQTDKKKRTPTKKKTKEEGSDFEILTEEEDEKEQLQKLILNSNIKFQEQKTGDYVYPTKLTPGKLYFDSNKYLFVMDENMQMQFYDKVVTLEEIHKFGLDLVYRIESSYQDSPVLILFSTDPSGNPFVFGIRKYGTKPSPVVDYIVEPSQVSRKKIKTMQKEGDLRILQVGKEKAKYFGFKNLLKFSKKLNKKTRKYDVFVTGPLYKSSLKENEMSAVSQISKVVPLKDYLEENVKSAT